MSGHFEKVKGYINELGYTISKENVAKELVVVSDESRYINQMVIDCEDPLLVVEQLIFTVKGQHIELYKALLKMNRDFEHGAFALDEDAERVLYRDTLQLENLDLNELDSSIASLSKVLRDHSGELIDLASGWSGVELIVHWQKWV